MAPPLSPGARRRLIPTRRFKKPGVKFRSFGVEVNAGYSPDQLKFFFGLIICIIRTSAIAGRAMFAPFTSANKQPEAPMKDDQINNPPLPPSGNQAVISTTITNVNQNNNSTNGNQNDSPLLSLFDVLVDEYEHQVKTHGLKPLYVDDETKTENINKQLTLAESRRKEAEELRKIPDRREEGEKLRMWAEEMRIDAIDNRRKQAKEMRIAAENKRTEIEKKYELLKDEKERVRRINEELVKSFYRRLHQSGERRIALCFSGGGIRSATFGLGVLQALARHVSLNRFHYLSTVSGGGYLGSWFSAWAHRRGMEEVQKGIEGNHDDKSPLRHEPVPILHLRRYSNYMSPKLGLLSADTWTLVGIYLRNLFLNWLVLIPLMAAALSLPRLWMSALHWNNANWYVVNGVFWLGFILGGISIAYIIINRPSLSDLIRRGWFPNISQKLRGERWFLIFGLGCLVVTAIASSLYWSWAHIHGASLWLPISSERQAMFNQFFNQQKLLGFMAFGVAIHLLGFALSQFFAPQIIKWKRYYCGGRDIICCVVTGVLGGLCLWGVERAFILPLGEPRSAALYACFAPPLFLLMFLVAATVFIGLASYYTTDADREWVARAGGWILIAIAVWTVVNGLVIFGPVGVIRLWNEFPNLLVSTGIGSGLITLIGGRSGATSAKKTEDDKTKKPGLPEKLLNLGVPFTAVIFALIFVATLSLATAALTEWIYNKLRPLELDAYLPNIFGWFNVKLTEITAGPLAQRHYEVLYQTPIWLALAILLILGVIGLVMGLFINVNKFSLHAAYRDRLVRAYLGASRSSNERRPNPFTGLDQQDNLQMHDLIRPVFSRDNFVNLDYLVKGIAHPETHIQRYIHSSLSQRTRDLIEKYQGMKEADPPPDAQQMKVIEDEVLRDLTDNFNRIIHGPPLHKDPAFKRVRIKELEKAEEGSEKHRKFSYINKELIEKQPVVPRLGAGWLLRRSWCRVPVEKLRINAMLLEAAFDGLIAPVPEELYEARPLHVVNMALNLVKGEELAWQDRKAQSFTVSPLHAGSPFEVGYRRSKNYATGRKQSESISLGTSLAISGAAASPNMGYHSSPVVTFLLALFNVRLGWWLGNPGKAGESTHWKPGPKFATGPLIAETLGRTDNNHPHVYLSDGGHFENLGLYEMVLRRCHLIVVSDGSQDKDFDFESLGNAISKIRTDLGIRITFNSIPISPREKKIPTFIKAPNGEEEKKKKYCAIGRIHYSEVDGGRPAEIDGFLLYIKPAIYGSEPADVQNYARANVAFPHESTGDQMFSENQFESYRALGFHEVSEIAPKGASESKIDLKEMFERIEKYLGEETPEGLNDPPKTSYSLSLAC